MKSAAFWRFKEGLHIVWRTGAQDIAGTLPGTKSPAFPVMNTLFTHQHRVKQHLSNSAEYKFRFFATARYTV